MSVISIRTMARGLFRSAVIYSKPGIPVNPSSKPFFGDMCNIFLGEPSKRFVRFLKKSQIRRWRSSELQTGQQQLARPLGESTKDWIFVLQTGQYCTRVLSVFNRHLIDYSKSKEFIYKLFYIVKLCARAVKGFWQSFLMF